MASTISYSNHFTFGLPIISTLNAQMQSALRAMVKFAVVHESQTKLAERLQYDVGEIDLRPIGRASNLNIQIHQGHSLDAMLMRGF